MRSRIDKGLPIDKPMSDLLREMREKQFQEVAAAYQDFQQGAVKSVPDKPPSTRKPVKPSKRK